MIECDGCDYFGKNYYGEGDCFFHGLPCDNDIIVSKWHPYPQEKPTEKNGYVVSVVNESNGYCFADISFYHPIIDRFEMDDVYQLRVTAWAELPQPYEGK